MTDLPPRRVGRPAGSKNKEKAAKPPTLVPTRGLGAVPDDISSPPVPTTEALERALTRQVASAIIGVSVSLVGQWASTGAVKTNPNGDIPLSEIRRKTIEWFKKNVGKRSGDEGEDAIDAKLRAERAKASLAELDLEERLGNLVSRSAAKSRTVDVFNMVKTRLMGMPEAFAAELASKTSAQDVKAFLAARIHEVLTDLSGPDATPED